MKTILTLSSVIILSFASLFTQSEMNINFKMPQKVTAGASFMLEVEVDKGDISNFAKLQMTVPEGFSIELLQGQGGTFTYFDQKMKLIWISLPTEPKFTVQLKVNTTRELSGDFTFDGKVSYVIEGERQSKILKTPSIKVGPMGTSTPTTTAAADATTTTASTVVKVNRKFDASTIANGGTFLVDIAVTKENISGVGKIIENLPEGLVAEEVESNGAIFSQKDGQVKFLWMTLPAENNFTVSYKVFANPGISGNKVIDGQMSYLDGSDTKKVLIDATSIKINAEETIVAANSTPATENANNNDENEVEEEETATTTPIENEVEPDEVVAAVNNLESNSTIAVKNATEETTTAEDAEDEIAAIEDSETTETVVDAQEEKQDENIAVTTTDNTTVASNHKVKYRVQICALRKKTDPQYFVTYHQITEKIFLNMHEGWHKYTVGNFNEYKKARNHRELIKNTKKIRGPFVTAYNNGTRITVQEALMITKDQWIQ